MHHLYPAAKGDPLCPLGFHPQVRWPTRCKRCFRDYKEHGNKKEAAGGGGGGGWGGGGGSALRRDDASASTPSLSAWSSAPSRDRDDGRSSAAGSGAAAERSSWSGAASPGAATVAPLSGGGRESDEGRVERFSARPASWTSTPDLGKLQDSAQAVVTTVSFTLPRRRPASAATPATATAAAPAAAPADTGQSPSPSAAGERRRRAVVPQPPASSPPLRRRRPAPEVTPDAIPDAAPNAARPPTESVTLRRPPAAAPAAAPKEQRAERKERAEAAARQRRVRIASLKEVHAVEEPSNPEVEFIIQKNYQEKASEGNLPKLESAGYSQGADWSDVERVKSSSKKPSKSGETNSYKTQSKATSSSSSGTSSDEESDDATSLAGTETTETTLIDRNESELMEQIESLKQELEAAKSRNERLEREKSDLLLRRIASMDMPSSRASSSEVTRLQQKVNELTTQMEDMRDDKKSLSLKVKELEQELEARPDKTVTQRAMDDLRSKLLAAETLCEELMDENEDMKRELRDLEEEIEEMQDNFREDQADEYSSLKKELEQTTKNCRILSFKLRKAERKTEALEAEKLELDAKCRQMAGGQTALEKIEKVSKLEHDLSVANEVASRLQKELDECKAKLKAKDEVASKEEKSTKKKAPKLADLSGHLKVSRESLTRGGSQEDPAVLLRDLQDAMEREADLREQLRFAEEEAQTLRKKTARIEDDNESLVLQLKKMATKARSRIKSPSPARMTPEPNEKDEGISEEEDPAELRLQLELNEQEAAVLRRKVDDLEKEGEKLKKKVKELEVKLNAKPARKSAASIITPEPGKGNAVYDQKIKVLEEELSECRLKLIEKERDIERLHAELTLTQKRSKGSIQKSKSLDSGNEQQALDLKRQLQAIEQEANILKTRNETLESENEKLTTENKRLVLLKNTKKTGGNDSSLELKEKIANLEAELSEAKNKVNELQSKNNSNSMTGDDKINSDEINKLKAEIAKVGGENEKLNETLKRLKDEATTVAAKFYKVRTPKKPTDLTGKVQLKKMVEDLESEIGEILVVLRKSEMEKTKLKKSSIDDNTQKETKEKLDDALKKITTLEKELKEEKEKAEREKKLLTKDKKSADDDKKKLDELKKKYDDEKKTWESQIKKAEEAKKKTEEDNRKLNDEKEKLFEEKKKIEKEVMNLKADKDASLTKKEEISVLVQRVESLKKELEEEQNQGVELRKKLEANQKVELEKTKLQREVAEKTTKLTETERKFKEADEKLKKTERLLSANKKKVTNLEKELGEVQVAQQGAAQGWLAERDQLKQQLAALQSALDARDAKANEEEERESTSKKGNVSGKEEVNVVKDELATAKNRLHEVTQALEKAESSKKSAEAAFKKQESELVKERDDFEKKAADMEMDLQAERKKIERMKNTHEKELRNRETELAILRNKLRSMESNTNVSGKKTAELQQDYETRIKKLEDELTGERQEYEDLTTKYEILEEEHVVTKAQLVMEKEALQSQLHAIKREMGSVETELRTLRETYNSKQDAWIKEKLDQQEKLKELEEKVSRSVNNETLNIERARSKAALEEKSIEIDNLRRESEVLADQMNHLKRENDDMRKKLEDFDKVVKVHRNMTADTSALENEVRDLKNKLFQEEKSHKADMAQLKLRYDSQVAVVGEELQSLQGQVSRFKRERDTFRHMLEGAQKNIAELKARGGGGGGDSRPSSSASGEESEETRTKIATLEQQINCMEDELSEARLESSKLKTELVSERSAWEIKISELQSRVNELEEERILTSGRTKIPGMRTRMELAWSKEREELQRLLQETSTLARDLRQTLFEVERERDKERLESKRRTDQLKRSTEEEVDEAKKKVTELQCDLLELRDAHAKLRTTNEKLRREKERHEKEREEMRQLAAGRRRAGQDDDRRVNALLEQVDELMRLAPDLFQSASSSQKSTDSGVTTPTPPRRTKGPKSRESSPGVERRDQSREPSVERRAQLQSTAQRLSEATEALRRAQRSGDEERERERARRALGVRRAASTESDNPPEGPSRPLGAGRTATNRSSLRRKALSLEQTSAQEQQSIWKTDDDGDGSLSSLQSVGSTDSRFYSLNRRENSMDSRLSGGSTQSEFVSGEKKKKKGLLGKLKQLTKSRSIDDTSTTRDFTSSQGSLGGSGSDLSLGGEEKGSKKDLRDRLTGMFKLPGSRAGSVERSKKEQSPALPERSASGNRPLIGGGSSTLPRPSPARSDVSTSSISRPLAAGKATPGGTSPVASSNMRRGK